MRVALTIVWLISLLCFGQCNRHPSHPLLGGYDLSGHDNSGRLVFRGGISVLSLEQNHLKGECTIAREKDAPEGLFDQNSKCEGLVDGNKVSLDLAPFLDDGGLLLDGEFDNDRITGIWRFEGFVTSEPLGNFEAVKKK